MLTATLVFFYVVFDMFSYGKAGRKAPYSVKILTQMQLSELLFTNQTKKSSSLILKGLSIFGFADATHE